MMFRTLLLSGLLTLAFGLFLSCAAEPSKSTQAEAPTTSLAMDTTLQQDRPETTPPLPGQIDTATFGAGCFWCVEAVFTELQGVQSVVSGFTGGHIKNPSYKEVCTGRTGHNEVAQIVFDPNVISFDELLEVFWKTHDPTTLNQQGNDIGDQYRSGVYYHNEDQRKLAEYYKEQLDASGAWENPIVTEIEPMTDFYAAENYHQDYYANNPEQGYCRYVIQPKVEKFRKAFKHKLKQQGE